jgi:methyl coenzyme M reductase beta subunit
VDLTGRGYLVHVGAVRAIKAVCWADDLNDPGFFEEGDAAGAYDVVHLAPRELPYQPVDE